MAVREIQVLWTPPSGIQTSTVMYWWDGVGVSTQRTRLNTFLTAINGFLTGDTLWTIATQGKVLNEQTGQMTGTWAEATPYSGAGSGTGEPVPDVAQILFRWGTNTVLNGRFVKGRSFIPGLAAENLLGGNIAGAAVGPMTTAASNLAGASAGFGVYHRPQNGTLGALVTINTADCASEMAVQRRRRNRV